MFTVCGYLLLSSQASCIRYTWVGSFTFSHTLHSHTPSTLIDAIWSQITVNGCLVLSPLYIILQCLFIWLFFTWIRIPQANSRATCSHRRENWFASTLVFLVLCPPTSLLWSTSREIPPARKVVTTSTPGRGAARTEVACNSDPNVIGKDQIWCVFCSTIILRMRGGGGGGEDLPVNYSRMRLVDPQHNRQSFWSSLQRRGFVIYSTSAWQYLFFLVSSWISRQWDRLDTGKRFQGNMKAIWEKWDLSIMRVYVVFTAPTDDIIQRWGWAWRSAINCAQGRDS